MIYLWIYLIVLGLLIFPGSVLVDYYSLLGGRDTFLSIFLDCDSWKEYVLISFIWPLALAAVIIVFIIAILFDLVPHLLTAPGRYVSKLIKKRKQLI